MALKEFAGVYYEEALDEKTRQLVAMARRGGPGGRLHLMSGSALRGREASRGH